MLLNSTPKGCYSSYAYSNVLGYWSLRMCKALKQIFIRHVIHLLTCLLHHLLAILRNSPPIISDDSGFHVSDPYCGEWPLFFFFSSQQTLAHLQCRGLICLIITVTELSKNRTQKTGCSVGYISTLLCTDCWSQWIKWKKKWFRQTVCV